MGVDVEIVCRSGRQAPIGAARGSCPRLDALQVAADDLEMPRGLAAFDTSMHSCPRCSASGRTCASCVQRRRLAWSLVTEQRKTPEAAAEIMDLSPSRIRRLVAEESDRRELRGFRCDSIPVQLTRSVIEAALKRDPELTVGELAHWLDMRQVDFERAFLGKPSAGRPKRRVNVSSASRLMIALGRAPNELPGC